MKFAVIVKAVLATVGAAAIATAGITAADPDSYPANVIQTNRKGKLPVRVIRPFDSNPVGDRVVLLFFHGWANEPDTNTLPSEEVVRNTFTPAVVHWREMAPRLVNVEFEDCFLAVCVTYPPQKDLEQNGRAVWYAVEAEDDLTRGGVEVIPVGHSMGVLVAKEYWNIDDRTKCIGFLSVGGPLGGAYLAVPEKVESGLVTLTGPAQGRHLMNLVRKKVDYSLPGIRCLRPDSVMRRRVVETDPFDESCYVFYGRIESAELNLASVVADFTDGLDLVLTPGSNNVDAAVIYGRLANITEAAGGGESDGMVPTGLAVWGTGNAHVELMEGCDHREVMAEKDSTEFFERQFLAIWEIYEGTHKEHEEFGVFDWVAPDLPVEHIPSFGGQLTGPIDIWAVDRELLAYESGRGWVKTGIRIPMGCEPDVDSTGMLVAVPTANGVILYNLTDKSCRQITMGSAAAVGWTGDNLLVAEDGQLILVSPEHALARVIVADDSLDISSRIVADDKTAWFKSGDALYKVGLAGVRLQLGSPQVELVETGVQYRPRPTKHGVIGVWQDGEKTRVAGQGSRRLGLDRPTRIILDHLVTGGILDQTSDIAVTHDGLVLLLVDRQVRLLDRELALKVVGEGVWKDWFGDPASKEVVLDYTLDQLAPRLGDQQALLIGAR